MIIIKLITILLIIQITSAIEVNGNDDNHMCTKNRNVTAVDGSTYIDPVEDCCDGYIPISSDKCIPRCLDCIYGSCAKPDVCECNKGYQMYKTKCIPICSPNCVRGICRKPGICGCFKGYELNATSSWNCVPKCEPKCPSFSTCMKPNNCQCNSGYKENKFNMECEPHCPDMPKNAKCMEPSNWECNDNFRHDLQINKCILNSCICNDKGYCLEHENQCECYEGFHKNPTTGKCESVCEPQCVNSTCIANNVCQCSNGYHATSKANICEKNGECNNQSCENGECLSTGECQCKAGFIRGVIYFETECIPTEIFMGKLMTLVVGIPIILALCILFIYYLIARRRTYINNEQPDRELQLLSEMH